MKIRLTIEVDLEPGMHLLDNDEKMWAENEVFVGDGSLILHSNEVDTIGVVKKVTNIEWFND